MNPLINSINFAKIINRVEEYYSDKILKYGAIPQGVDWNSEVSQFLRFEQLLKVCQGETDFSINDFGCGYGALFNYMTDRGYKFTYFGYDLSSIMLDRAEEFYQDYKNAAFSGDTSDLKPADFTVASGIFNVKQEIEKKEWENYILETLKELAKLSLRGFAFNLLTQYSDRDRMRDDLYYGDPCFFFDFCKRNFSQNVALLHDYNLYEFTILTKK